MESIIYAAPLNAGKAPVAWPGLAMQWIGWDGTAWDLATGVSGLGMMPGVRGLHMPPTKHYKDTYPTTAGSRWRGYQIEEREVFWPIQVYSDYGTQEWLNHDKAFWRTMSPAKTGTWLVTQPNGTTRSLTLRFQDDGQTTFDIDPSIVGWANYGITFTAEQPFWTEPEISRTFRPTGSSGFFSAAGSGSVINITAGSALSGASLYNPGDEPAYPIWEIVGPTSQATITVDGRSINIPFAVPSGSKLVIDTNPEVLSAVLGGVDRTQDLGSADFAQLPVGDVSTMSLNVVGSGYVSVRFTPRYYRAW